ncbi:DUF2167 domain-containing protein [Luteibacter sp.]|jgi:uncharacterized membrane-anchored protein|uniref:DUF2167 domain-containing protein n=1 Tax=Luteibacter sp. TaxID=1886636 RepID=UPI002F3F8FFB
MTIMSGMARMAMLAALFAAPFHAIADEGASERALLNSLKLQTGTVPVPAAHATLALQPGYSFLSANDAQKVLTDLWGNPPDKDVLGMIVPGETPSALVDESTWAVVVTYSDDGHVKDDDASTIDYDDLLKDMKKGVEESSAERVKQGYPAIELVGWATPPHYDAAAHKLYWARDLKFTKDGHSGRSLNYDIRVLGRHGYLQLSAVAPLTLLPKVEADMPKVLAMTEFDPGVRYTDFSPGTDKVAAYGIAALVAGGIAAKAGLFAKLGLLLLGLKKFLIIGIVAIGAAIKKLFNRKQA